MTSVFASGKGCGIRSKMRLFAIFLYTVTINWVATVQEHEMCLLSIYFALYVAIPVAYECVFVYILYMLTQIS